MVSSNVEASAVKCSSAERRLRPRWPRSRGTGGVVDGEERHGGRVAREWPGVAYQARPKLLQWRQVEQREKRGERVGGKDAGGGSCAPLKDAVGATIRGGGALAVHRQQRGARRFGMAAPLRIAGPTRQRVEKEEKEKWRNRLSLVFLLSEIRIFDQLNGQIWKKLQLD